MFDGACLVDVAEGTHLLATDLIEGVGGEPLDMEAVEDDLSAWGSMSDGLDIGGGHIERDGLETARALGAELVEEALEGLGAFALGGPDHAPFDVIDDDGEVVVPLSVRELVDADEHEAVEPLGVQAALHDALDDGADAPPGDPE